MSEMPRIALETARPFEFRSPALPGFGASPRNAPTGLKTSRTPEQPIDPNKLPHEYALLLDGVCLEPMIPDRAVGVMDKRAKFGPGDIICIWFAPEVIAPGGHRAWLKRLSVHLPPFVTFPWREDLSSATQAVCVCEQLNPPRRYFLPCADIVAVHKVIGFLPPGNSRPGQLIDPKTIRRL